ncbi:putative 2-aminoethylphosphonate ABC transporter substrate-binding protein [Oceanospirillum sp.]|uniref:putative 2-aminoethylphosphonate ABC transporter substrate-binding protein n=1 Tax=Oceanospirillum sp. TaxID=2021254 RepID=UPI003A953B49
MYLTQPIKKITLGLAGAVALMAGSAQANTELKVYTALETEQLRPYAKAFNTQYPDISIKWVRDSTGIVTAKLLAEKNNPQADVIWGLAATSLLVLKEQDMLEPYAPKGLEKLSPKFRDKATTPSWVGMDAWMASLCFNTIEAEKLGLPKPSSWEDLTKPVYKGHVVMPNPASSGTGFLDVSSWLQLFGEDKGWGYMDRLHKNIARYTHSGSKPCKLAAAGEAPIGISFAYKGASLKKKGAPLDVIYPQEGLGWDMEAASIVKGTKKLDAAQKLMDFAVSKEANKLYNKSFAVVAYPGVAQQIPYFPADAESLMMNNDFEWSASNRKQILSKWQSRYDSKSDPK